MPKIARIEGVQYPHHNDVFVNGVRLDPAISQKVFNHSPDGFSWGYQGSGPAQTALAICLHLLGDDNAALEVYQAFKRQYVAKWTMDEDFAEDIDFVAFINRALS